KESRKRYSPHSTYKIYLPIFPLHHHIITHKNSPISSNHKHYPFHSSNNQQHLNTPIQNSLNSYFQPITNQIPKNYTPTQ
uniref:penicillin-binding transpeptidase domain-containing protein n=1 Tax=Staphylococcus epidermidis TaxID=1282 RepID=UPI0021B249AC